MTFLPNVARIRLAVIVAALCAGCGTAPPAVAPAPPVVTAPGSGDAQRSAATASPTTSVPLGEVVYSADWSTDLDGWTGNEDWTVSDGELLCSGQINQLTAGVVAPVDVDELDGYAVEAEIRLLRYEISNGSFGVMVHLQEDGAGYGAGHDESDEEARLRIQGDGGRPVLDARPFRPGTEWHRYRIEVRGNELTVYIDGAPVLAATDNTYLTGRVGLWSRGAQLAVREFTTTELVTR